MVNPLGHEGVEMLPAPKDEECYPAIAFPIEQVGADGVDKIRRGEIWKLMCDLLRRGGIADFDTSTELHRICDEIRSHRTPIPMGEAVGGSWQRNQWA